MKKHVLSLFILMTGFAFSQQSVFEGDMKYWYYQDFSKSNVYGVGSDEAHKKLKLLKLKPKPLIVAVIDSGVDAEHQDLKANMWINTKEIPNNKIDDDNNGYVDDIHGWNFIGNPNGENVNGDTMELTRLYVEYKAKFESTDENSNKINQQNDSIKFKEYKKIKARFLEKANIAKRNSSRYEEIYNRTKNNLEKLTPYFTNKLLTDENIKSVAEKTDLSDEIKKSIDLLKFYASQDPDVKKLKFEEFKDGVLESIKEGVDHYMAGSKYHYNTELDTRKIVGDDYNNLTEKGYGNNNVEGPDALHGTHVAGIISAVRANGIGMDGIAGNHVKIMSVRAVPDGDERDKDVANAIFYAVDNGAKIINMSFGKGYSPNKERVWEAMKYAESKDVLLVHAAGNDNDNNDEIENYPTNHPVKGEPNKIVETYITVGASTVSPEDLKASFSNFGKVEVDIFAPGSEIYSTIPDNQYKFLQGTSMASPVVAGCAALLWSYFPKLSAKQVKDILMQSANKSDNLKNMAQVDGVVDVNRAIELALKDYSSYK